MSFTQLFHTLRSRRCVERCLYVLWSCRVAVSPSAFVISSCRAQTGAHKHWIFSPTHRQMKGKKRSRFPRAEGGLGYNIFGFYLFTPPTATNYTLVVTSNSRNATCLKWKLDSLLSSPKIKFKHQRSPSGRMRDTPWTGDQPSAGHTLTPGGGG